MKTIFVVMEYIIPMRGEEDELFADSAWFDEERAKGAANELRSLIKKKRQHPARGGGRQLGEKWVVEVHKVEVGA